MAKKRNKRAPADEDTGYFALHTLLQDVQKSLRTSADALAFLTGPGRADSAKFIMDASIKRLRTMEIHLRYLMRSVNDIRDVTLDQPASLQSTSRKSKKTVLHINK